MATSGSYDYSLSAANIIQAAWEDLNIIVAGGTVPTADATMALTRLNMLVKQWQGTADGAPGIRINTRQRITLMLAKGQQTYTIGPAATDSRASTLMGRTTVNTNYVSGTSIIAAANTDTTTYPGTTVAMTSVDFIGVQLNDGTIGWTTLNGTPGSTTLTLTAGFSVAAGVGNYIWWFTARAQRFPVLETAVLHNAQGIDMPLRIYREVLDYEKLPDKGADSDPWAILCEPLRLNTRITLSAQPQDVTKQINLTVLYPAEDYDASSNDIAYPQEALLALSAALAKVCAPAKRVTWTPLMEANYQVAMATYRELNPAQSSAYFQPGKDW